MQILTTTSNSLTLAWVAPLSHGANDNELCNQCEEDLSLMQYATQAWSPDSANTTGYFSAMHATGMSLYFKTITNICIHFINYIK